MTLQVFIKLMSGFLLILLPSPLSTGPCVSWWPRDYRFSYGCCYPDQWLYSLDLSRPVMDSPL